MFLFVYICFTLNLWLPTHPNWICMKSVQYMKFSFQWIGFSTVQLFQSYRFKKNNILTFLTPCVWNISHVDDGYRHFIKGQTFRCVRCVFMPTYRSGLFKFCLLCLSFILFVPFMAFCWFQIMYNLCCISDWWPPNVRKSDLKIKLYLLVMKSLQNHIEEGCSYRMDWFVWSGQIALWKQSDKTVYCLLVCI